MKNFFLTLALVLISTFSFAKTTNKLPVTNESPAKIVLNVVTKDIKENIKIEFSSLEDFKQFDENQLTEILSDDNPGSTVTATLTISDIANGGVVNGGGSVTTTVTASVAASCSQIAAKVKALKASLLAAIK